MNQFCEHVNAALKALAENGVRISGCGECWGDPPWIQCILCRETWEAPHSRGWVGAPLAIIPASPSP